MKKNLLLILICSLLGNASIVYSQNPVPNAGFENWTAGNPDGWSTTNVAGFAMPITDTTPAYSGALALKGEVVSTGIGNYPPFLTSTDSAGNGFAITQQFGTFSYYYKFNAVGPVTFNSFLAITDASGNGVGNAAISISASASSFTLASAPILYFGPNPDSCIILFSLSDSAGGVPALGNYFIIDEVSLSGAVGEAEFTPLSFSIEKVVPNPASNVSTIYYSLSANSDVTLTLYDVAGKKYKVLPLVNETAGRHKVELNVTDVPAGFYILHMNSPEGIKAASLQIAR